MPRPKEASRKEKNVWLNVWLSRTPVLP